MYGHVAGARELFALFAKIGRDEALQIGLLHTHPFTSERLARVEELARERGWALAGRVRELPPALAKLKRAAPAK